MDFSRRTLKSVLFVASLGLSVQALLWVVLSSLAVASYQCLLKMSSNESLLTDLVIMYFEDEGCGGKQRADDRDTLTPKDVHPWMVAYLTMSVIQLVLSGRLFYCRNKRDDHLRIIVKDWCILSLSILLMDITLTGLFIADYVTLKDRGTEEGSTYAADGESADSSIPLAMFIISARGFALWLINVVEVGYLSLWAWCGSQEEEAEGEVRPATADRHGSDFGRTPPPVRPGEKTRGPQHPGHAYLTAYDNHNYFASTESLAGVLSEGRTEADDGRGRSPYSTRSVDSAEAVTPFNVEENSSTEITRSRLTRSREGNATKATDANLGCNCYRSAANGKTDPTWGNRPFHSHGCSLLKSELERKLDTIRSKKVSDLPDFSHDMKNFNRGGGGGGPSLQKRRFVEPPTLPSAATAQKSNFF